MNENNTHPLTVNRAIEMWDKCSKANGGPFAARLDDMPQEDRGATLIAMCAAYDAGREHERAEDDRPWEPLDKDDPLNAGDEARLDNSGITATAVVASVDEDGEPWTAEGALIGLRRYGTWYVRRPAQPLPTEDGAVIIPADGREFFETFAGRVDKLVHLSGKWYGGSFPLRPEQIVPGTWRDA